jgi:hypothetical protein
MKVLRNNAQAATELAVFGAILIFVIGSIVRVSIQSGMEQNQALKAMRWALSQSLRGVRTENKSRDSASILVVEDRLSPDPGKFGSLERTPLLHMGYGTFSNTIFMPMDWMENKNIPIMDVFVNGKHFTFTTGRFVEYDVRLDPNNLNQIRVWDVTTDPGMNRPKYFPRVENGNWLTNCYSGVDTTIVPPRPYTIGCPIFHTVIPVNSADFCEDGTCDESVSSTAQRFDLNLNFRYDDDPQGEDRNNMVWQWKPVKGLIGSIKINADDGVYSSYDIDYDRKEEVIYAAKPAPAGHPQIIARLSVFDSQKGDINLSIDDTDRLNASVSEPMDMGIQKDVSVYTITQDGTTLQILQNKAFDPGTGNFVRSVNRKDQIDVISRMFQLSNDTGRYCPGLGQPPPTIPNSGGLPNPVEQCVNTKAPGGGDCFNQRTVSMTCFDKGTNMLFIRSRLEERRGRKWITQIEE